MELLTGMMALDEERPEESHYLASWFCQMKTDKEKLRSIIDPSIAITDETFESVLIIADLAGHCAARDPHQRPEMGHAVNVLASLVEKWMPINDDQEEYLGIDFHQPLLQMVKGWQAADGTADVCSVSLNDSKGSIPARPAGFADRADADARSVDDNRRIKCGRLAHARGAVVVGDWGETERLSRKHRAMADGFKIEQNHGKSRVRVARVWRRVAGSGDVIVEWNVGVSLFSDCLPAYTSADNSAIVATDSMKNTVRLDLLFLGVESECPIDEIPNLFLFLLGGGMFDRCMRRRRSARRSRRWKASRFFSGGTSLRTILR
ncbi:hypothetical protein BHE74_00007714 [Ensete ventricosum]|nr:hypothetical protein BHE74_00007714 [Ensete ventricosum]